jgi:hypothetical protein
MIPVWSAVLREGLVSDLDGVHRTMVRDSHRTPVPRNDHHHSNMNSGFNIYCASPVSLQPDTGL